MASSSIAPTSASDRAPPPRRPPRRPRGDSAAPSSKRSRLDGEDDAARRQRAERAGELDRLGEAEAVRGHRRTSPAAAARRRRRSGWIVPGGAPDSAGVDEDGASRIAEPVEQRRRLAVGLDEHRTSPGTRPRSRRATIRPTASSPRSGLPMPITTQRPAHRASRSPPVDARGRGNGWRRRCTGRSCAPSARSDGGAPRRAGRASRR